MLSVVIGRFQTPHLTEAHLKLFEEARKSSHRILVLIGCTAAIGTDKNPLSYEMRKHMIDDKLPDDYLLHFAELHDNPSNKDWSDQIDDLINKHGETEAIIFAGRDNSVEGYYSGKHPIKTIEELPNHSATALRKKIAKNPVYGYNARAGIIHHIENRYPIVYSTVDVAITWGRNEYGLAAHVLMGKKGDKFNFIGGFVDPSDESLFEAARREAHEETGFKIDNFDDDFTHFNYRFSHKVEDERYHNTKDSIMTHFFCVTMLDQKLPDKNKISDKEFKEFAWIPANESSLDLISDAHKSLFLKFINSKN